MIQVFIAQESGPVEIRLGHVTVRMDMQAGDELFLASGERCPKCAGSGFLVRDAVYCECPVGKGLQGHRAAG